MKRHILSFVGFTALAISAGPAVAACSDELARMSPGMTTGSVAGTSSAGGSGQVAKDGSTAPLQTGSTGSAQSNAQANRSSSSDGGIAKDGSTMPMASQPGGGNTNVATSGQDVQAQQRGDRTAASAATGGTTASGSRSPAMMAALDRARTMQQQGNEAGCMEAINEAKRMQ